jgi:hypothetical protein
MTPSGIKPATFRLVPQCLNYLCHDLPILHIFRNVRTVTLPCRISADRHQTAEDVTSLNHEFQVTVRDGRSRHCEESQCRSLTEEAGSLYIVTTSP